ncbi:MAG TPA: sigma 54 modulation/S30EA ribosomal C-terminal domain-containing protein [Kineosporiaceae bacterium]|nr:sigma 54 modulation/S30EA ribosomal C-terminal domain-containing protein [Kineosporiaceae bacterium]
MTVGSQSVTVQLTVRGDIPQDDRAYAVRKVGRVLEMAHRPVLKAHLVLGWEPDPAHTHPARLEVGLDVDGVPVRAHIAADSIREGADLLQGRLSRRLVQLQDRARARHRWAEAMRAAGAPGAQPPRPPSHRNDPTEPSEIFRRKTFAAHPLTPDEAAYEMDLLDHDFYLYTNKETGSEAVAYRSTGRHDVLLTPAALTEEQAKEHLDLGGEPFVFYRDPDDDRGRVLYRRFDGGYGLITPV